MDAATPLSRGTADTGSPPQSREEAHTGSRRRGWIRFGVAVGLSLAVLGLRVKTRLPTRTLELSSSSSSSPEEKERPHILLALIDDQGYADMGYGNDFDALKFATPFMDSLARTGIRLRNYYTQQLCTPARAALLTGKYPIHTGMQHDVIQPESTFGLPLDHTLLPAYLKERGYRTAAIGKWHLGHYRQGYLPSERGFDHFFGFLSDQLWYYTHESPHACVDSSSEEEDRCFWDMNRNGDNADETIGTYSTVLFRDAVEDVLRVNSSDVPLFTYLSWQAVHGPLDAPPVGSLNGEEMTLLETIDDRQRRTFAAMTMMLDKSMRRIVEAMEAQKYYDNSIIIVASDNGGCASSGGYNYPLRGGKQYLYEGGIHVNAFIHSPLLPLERRGSIFDGLVHVTDWLPTLVSGVLGMPVTDDIDGVDQWSALLSGGSPPRTEILHNIDRWALNTLFTDNLTTLTTPIQAIRQGHMKLLMGQDFPGIAVPHATRRLDDISPNALGDCHYDYSDAVYLFNITQDPSETENLVTAMPDVVSALVARLAVYARTEVSPAYKGCDDTDAYRAWTSKGWFIGPFR